MLSVDDIDRAVGSRTGPKTCGRHILECGALSAAFVFCFCLTMVATKAEKQKRRKSTALQKGFGDTDLDPLRGCEDFKKLLAAMEKKK